MKFRLDEHQCLFIEGDKGTHIFFLSRNEIEELKLVVNDFCD